jgi:hypothetical protein
LLACILQQCFLLSSKPTPHLVEHTTLKIKTDYQGEFNMPIPVRVVNDLLLATGSPSPGFASRSPVVEALANGQILLGFQSGFATDTDARVRAYSASPSTLLGVNSTSPNGSFSLNDGQVSISSYNDGSFVAAYQRTASPVGVDTGDIYIRFCNAAGIFVGPEIAVSAVSGEQSRPEVEVFKNGNVLVTWIDEATLRVRYAVYDQAGTVVNAATDLSTTPVTQQPSVALDYKLGTTLLDNGNVVISYFEFVGSPSGPYNVRFSILSNWGWYIKFSDI